MAEEPRATSLDGEDPDGAQAMLVGARETSRENLPAKLSPTPSTFCFSPSPARSTSNSISTTPSWRSSSSTPLRGSSSSTPSWRSRSTSSSRDLGEIALLADYRKNLWSLGEIERRSEDQFGAEREE